VKYHGEIPLDNEYTLENLKKRKFKLVLLREWILIGGGRGNEDGEEG
jgi:hypothetical protein